MPVVRSRQVPDRPANDVPATPVSATPVSATPVSATPVSTNPVVMSFDGVLDIGAVLREARTAHKLSLTACARTLSVRPQDLEALEANAFQNLPGGGITVAWLRRYARLVRIDPEPLTVSYHRHHAAEAHSFRSDLTATASGRRRARKKGRAVRLALAVLVLGGGLGAVFTVHQLLSLRGPLPALLADDSTTQSTPDMVPVLLIPPAATLPAAAEGIPAAPAGDRTVVGTAPLAASRYRDQTIPQHPVMGRFAAAPVMAGSGLLRFRALERVNLEIHDGNNTLVFKGTLKTGEIYTIPATRTGLRMQADNPAALQLIGAGAQ
jgi:Helix-turn-helix domain